MNKTGLAFPKPNTQKFSLEKIENAYVNSLEELIKVLSEIVISLCSEGTIHYSVVRCRGITFTRRT